MVSFASGCNYADTKASICTELLTGCTLCDALDYCKEEGSSKNSTFNAHNLNRSQLFHFC